MPRLSRAASRLPPVRILQDEYERLADYVCASPVETEAVALLWSELLRAEIVEPARAPQDLVRMCSVVRFTDLLTSQEHEVRLVYDEDPQGPGDMPVASVLGAALIGLRPGAVFSWTSEGRAQAIRIDAVSAGSAKRGKGRSMSRRREEGGRRSAPSIDVDEALHQTFPASDPPSWTLGRERG